MLSAQERYRWHELTEQLAKDEKRIDRAVLTATVHHGRVSNWLRTWLPLLVLPCVGLAIAVAGTRQQLGLPALGLFGVGLIVMAPLAQVWYFDHVVNKHYRPRG